MKELLRVTMNAKQIREACADFAADRTAVKGVHRIEGVADDMVVTVSVVQRRERKPKPAEAQP